MEIDPTTGYPRDWPRCRCGQPVLDGHLTCGNVACGTEADAEARIRDAANRTGRDEHGNWRMPQDNPNCVCYPNLLAAFFCHYGHMTECHYPFTCKQAKCSHLDRYL